MSKAPPPPDYQGMQSPPPPYPGPPPGAYPPPPPGPYMAPPVYHQQQSTVIIQQNVPQQQRVVHCVHFGEHPVRLQCPFCSQDVITSTQTSVSSYTWLLSCLIIGVGCLFGLPLFLGCCLIPCCLTSCKDVDHKCPRCNRQVGALHRKC